MLDDKWGVSINLGYQFICLLSMGGRVGADTLSLRFWDVYLEYTLFLCDANVACYDFGSSFLSLKIKNWLYLKLAVVLGTVYSHF